jgi:regulation of enolase protein 1 (concanavalin A-like superfamily)
LKPESRGLRITVPHHQGDKKPSVGFQPLLKIHGDFEIAASYELLSIDPPKAGAGAGANLYILAEATLHAASFRRCVTPDGDDAFFVHVSTRDQSGKRRPQYNYFPAETKSGRLCLKRTGSTLQFLVVEGEGDKRRKLHEVEFGAGTIGLLRVETTTGGSRTTAENLWKDFTIQATRLEPVDIPVFHNRQLLTSRRAGEPPTLLKSQSRRRSNGETSDGPEFRLYDGFDGKFQLNWEPVRPDSTHMSLTKNPGKLTLTTQRGGIYGGVGPSAKNFYLIRNPVAEGGDFVLTTCIESFRPTMHWQQAGLLVYDDDDNYLKCDIERGKTDVRFACIRETAGEPTSETDWPGIDAERVWIRVIKRGETYERAYSTDGREFVSGGMVDWGNGAPKWIGIVAKNGPTGADEIDAAFDFFEIRLLTSANHHARSEKPRNHGF